MTWEAPVGGKASDVGDIIGGVDMFNDGNPAEPVQLVASACTVLRSACLVMCRHCDHLRVWCIIQSEVTQSHPSPHWLCMSHLPWPLLQHLLHRYT